MITGLIALSPFDSPFSPPGHFYLPPPSSLLHVTLFDHRWASLVAQMVKNLLAVQETWVQSLDPENPLEKGMTNHFSIPAWRIPWMEEPDRL